MSEKALEVLSKLGISADFTAEEIDTDAIVNEFRSKQIDLFKLDPDLIDPIKDQVKTEASIVATKKAKKALNEKAGLGLSNKEMDEIEYGAMLDLVHDKYSKSATSEVSQLQQQIIDLTNKAKEIEETAESRVKDVEKAWAEKYLAGRRGEVMAKTVGELELIIAKEKAAKFLELEMKERGYNIDFGDDGQAVIKKGEYEALNAEKTGKLTVRQLAEDILIDFVKKSNGAPTMNNNVRTTADIPDNLPAAMRARLEEMKAKIAEQ